MRRALNTLIWLYPKKWRDRYRNEYSALLNDVSPTWRTFFDVLGGGLKMQFKMSSAWKIVAGFAIAGVLAAVAFLYTTPARYKSTAVIRVKMEPGQMEKVLSRSALSQLINEENLYQSERSRQPIEDVIQTMKNNIAIRSAGPGEVAVSFTAANAQQARETTERLAYAFNDSKTWSLLNPPSPPVPNGPRRSRVIVLGLVSGLLAGCLFALFSGLRVWKLATSLGLAGALLFAIASYLLPDRYSSIAVLQYHGTEAQMRETIRTVMSGPDLERVVTMFRIFPGDSQAVRKLSDHLHLEPLPANAVVLIKFDDTNRYQAQKVTQRVAYYLMDEAAKAPSPMTVEMIDPASLSLNPYFPNRLNVAGGGLALGLLVATMLGIRGSRQVPPTRVATVRID